MRTTVATKYNPYAQEMSDDIFLLDEEFDQIDKLDPVQNSAFKRFF